MWEIGVLKMEKKSKRYPANIRYEKKTYKKKKEDPELKQVSAWVKVEAVPLVKRILKIFGKRP